MENKLLLTFLILVQIVFFAFCDTESDSNQFDSFGPQPNENPDPENMNLLQGKDSDASEPNETAQSIPERPLFNGIFADTDSNVFDNSQDVARTVSDRNNKMQTIYSNPIGQKTAEFQQEKKRYFNPINQQGLYFIESNNSPTRNQGGNSGYSIYKPRRNERQKYEQYQKDIESFGERAAASNTKKTNANSGDRDDGFVASSWGYNAGMNQFFQQESPMPERKVSVTVLNEEVNAADSYKQALMNNFFKSQMNSNFNDFNRNPEKGIVINFNSDCPTSKTCPNPLYQKFVYPPKAEIRQPEVPTFQYSQRPQISQIRQMPQMSQLPQISQIQQMPQMPQMSQISQISQIPQISPMSQVPQISQFSQIPETPIYTRELTTPIYCM